MSICQRVTDTHNLRLAHTHIPGTQAHSLKHIASWGEWGNDANVLEANVMRDLKGPVRFIGLVFD